MEGLGGMIHGCWTYWGHSGAPIVGVEGAGEGGGLRCVGIHNSWNDDNGDRHGVDGAVIIKFLKRKGFGWTVEGGVVEENKEERGRVIDLT